MQKNSTGDKTFVGQLAFIEYKAREFRTVVIDVDGMGEDVPTLGINLSDASEMTGLDKEFLMGMVRDSLLLETPTCNYIHLLQEDDNDELIAEKLWIEFADLVDLICECIKYHTEIKPHPLVDFLDWYSTKGMYLSCITSFESYQQESLDNFRQSRQQSQAYKSDNLIEMSSAVGLIYFILDSSSHAVKIGFTAGKVEDRLSGLQVGNPNPLELIKVIRGTLKREKEIHSRFKAIKLSGEWFKASGELLEFIQLI